MAMFRVLRGLENNLPTAIVDGSLYFCTNTNNLYLDCGSTRYKIAAKYADFLRYVGDEGTTVEIDPKTILTDSNYVTKIGTASAEKAGLMSTTDKSKLDGVAQGATKVIVDASLDAASENPVQNKAIKAALDLKAGLDTATATTNGLMSAADKAQLDSLVATGGEVNQNAFSKITIDGTEIAATAKTDNISIVAGENVTLTPNVDGKQITISAKDTTYNAASTSNAGLMSAADKEKLDSISREANKYELPAATSSTLGGIKVGTNLSIDGNGVLSATDTTYELVQPVEGSKGLMSGNDSIKLASIESGANKTIVDAEMSADSTNPVQNKVVKSYVDTTVSTAVAGLVDTAPEALDTLNELAAALGDDPNFATTIATQIGGKVDKVEGKGLSTNDYTDDEKAKLAGIGTVTMDKEGLMPAADKVKLDGVATGAQVNVLEGITSGSLTVGTISNKNIQLDIEWVDF